MDATESPIRLFSHRNVPAARQLRDSVSNIKNTLDNTMKQALDQVDVFVKDLKKQFGDEATSKFVAAYERERALIMLCSVVVNHINDCLADQLVSRAPSDYNLNVPSRDRVADLIDEIYAPEVTKALRTRTGNRVP